MKRPYWGHLRTNFSVHYSNDEYHVVPKISSIHYSNEYSVYNMIFIITKMNV